MFRNRKKMNLEKGKKMFFECFGSSIALDRDYGSEYKNCNIPKEIEEQWLIKIKFDLEKRVQAYEGLNSISALINLIQINYLEDRLELLVNTLASKQLDTFSRIMVCESLKNEKRYSKDLKINSLIEKIIIDNKLMMLSSPITVHKTYKNASYMMNYDFSDENLKNRINEL